MELNITKIVGDIDPSYYSASRAELGPDARRITWENAMDYVEENPILETEEQRQEASDYFKDCGGWDEDEIPAWSHQELDALLLQEISLNLRQAEHHGGLGTEEWEKACEDGQILGGVYQGDDGEVYIYIG